MDEQPSKPLNETQIRLLRNVVFDHEIDDEGWAMTRKNWLKPDSAKWLQEHQRKILI